ncbi:hypothetical protein AB0K60_37100 [Thermopolyspora sp. NPDC052614]|uniref:hypothetical protein n=1 Tax=Thermopolyspora sp. NPDC052614 TaxID=3155682 RepID=UPI00342BADEC
MQFPIDTSGLAFTVAAPPTPARDFATKKAKVTDDGEPVMQVTVLAMDGTDSMKIKFTVVGAVQLAQGQPVQISGLCFATAKEGEMRWWQARAVEPIGYGPGAFPAESADSAGVMEQSEPPGGGRARAGRNPHAPVRHGAPPASPGGPGGPAGPPVPGGGEV